VRLRNRNPKLKNPKKNVPLGGRRVWKIEGMEDLGQRRVCIVALRMALGGSALGSGQHTCQTRGEGDFGSGQESKGNFSGVKAED
jgi:hypothetical protein